MWLTGRTEAWLTAGQQMIRPWLRFSLFYFHGTIHSGCCDSCVRSTDAEAPWDTGRNLIFSLFSVQHLSSLSLCSRIEQLLKSVVMEVLCEVTSVSNFRTWGKQQNRLEEKKGFLCLAGINICTVNRFIYLMLSSDQAKSAKTHCILVHQLHGSVAASVVLPQQLLHW